MNALAHASRIIVCDVSSGLEAILGTDVVLSSIRPQRDGSSLRNPAASFAAAADMRHDREKLAEPSEGSAMRLSSANTLT